MAIFIREEDARGNIIHVHNPQDFAEHGCRTVLAVSPDAFAVCADSGQMWQSRPNRPTIFELNSEGKVLRRIFPGHVARSEL
jgi:hypothetical protein